MADVSIRDLRNRAWECVERVLAGESVRVTRAGIPVAELRPIARREVDSAELLRRWRKLPALDPQHLRDDLDAALDSRF